MYNQFDQEKLKIFFEEELEINDHTALIVRVYSYDSNEKRIKILTKVLRKNGSFRFLKQFPPLLKTEQIVALKKILNKCETMLN